MDKLPLTLTWEAVCADPSLRDLPYKIELNRFNQIVMAPANLLHGRYQMKIGQLLGRLMKGGDSISEAAIQTTDNVKVPDVIWASRAWINQHGRKANAPVAPEICVEVLSPDNTSDEIATKRALYFEAGAQEVWVCTDDGTVSFFASTGPLKRSALCPRFPVRVKI